MCEFINKNLDKLWTLISIVIGAVISYVATSAAEMRKEKHTQQREKLKRIMIPYCSTVEETIDCLNKYKHVDIDDLLNQSRQPLVYLKAEKRVYFDKSQRSMLNEYKNKVNELTKNLDESVSKVSQSYKIWLEDILVGFTHVAEPSFGVHANFDSGFTKKMREMILKKGTYSFLERVSSVYFMHNDNPVNYEYTDVSLSKRNRETYEAIECDAISLEDVDPEEALAAHLLEFMSEIDDEKKITALIGQTNANEMLLINKEQLIKIQKHLIKSIDKMSK